MSPSDPLKLAFAAYRSGRLPEARDLCVSMVRSRPHQVEALFMLAVVEMASGRTPLAESLFRHVLALRPDLADACANLATIRLNRGDPTEAAALHGRAIRLRPETAGSYLGRGLARQNQGESKAAAADFRRTIILEPASAAAWRGLGQSTLAAGDPLAAVLAFDRVLQLDPGGLAVLSESLHARLSACDWGGFAERQERLLQVIDTATGVVLPLLYQLIEASPAQQFQAACAFFRAEVQPAVIRTVSTRPAVRARKMLTVAYLSADFHEHATAYLTAELFELHDRDHFRILGLSHGPDDGGPMRRRLVQAFDRFHDISGQSLDQVAALCAEEPVDLLVDLKGYTRGARLDLLAQRLAPVQVAWLGYPGTLGGAPVDYIIGDRWVTPPAGQSWFSERLVVLPDSYQVNDRQRQRPQLPGLTERGRLRVANGLPETGFVFGAFHAPHKITPAMFGLWMQVLTAVPGSVLWLFDPHGAAATNLRQAAARQGVDPSRLVFARHRPLTEHLARYLLVDLSLDSFPYTGHTTSSDALWMGVPVVTRKGEGFAASVTASLLHAAELPEVITGSDADYVAVALTLAQKPERLTALRERLRTRRTTAPLFDTPRFVGHLEQAYQVMWSRYAEGLPPAGFTVPARSP
jgi:protein O-GlcNAc transferase